MGHTNSTANLALPQFIGTDKPTWLSDVNGAFAAIDTYAGNNDAALAITDAKADTAIGDAASAVTTAGNAATTAGNAAATATAANTVAGNALTVANGINAKVGVLTDLTTTDKSTVVNAINEVNGKDAGDIAYDNAGSGLTATNVQDAIDEVAQGGGGGGSIDTLWTNPDTTTDYAGSAETLAHDISDYKMIAVEFLKVKSGTGIITQSMISQAGTMLLQMVTMSGGATLGVDRSVTFSGTTATFGHAKKQTDDRNVDNNAIPVKVYGIKF